MKIDEIVYELTTIGRSELSPFEDNALREAIPILTRCEKYRKSLEKIEALVHGDTNETGLKIQRLIIQTFDCEES